MEKIIDFLAHEITLLVATLLATVLGAPVVKGYLDADHASAIVQALAAGVGVVITALLHQFALTPIAGKLQDAAKKWIVDPPVPPPAALLFILLVPAVALTGCQAPPPSTQPGVVTTQPGLTMTESRIILLSEKVAYGLAQNKVNADIQSGKLSGPTKLAAESGLQALAQRISDNQKAVNSGQPINLQTADSTFYNALDDFTTNYLNSLVPVPSP